MSNAPPGLRERLAAMRAASRAAMPEERRALSVGRPAPDFALPDDAGRVVGLSELLARGPVVLTFYRGVWCPYCNEDLKALQAALPAFRDRGAALVSISPQTAANSQRAKRDHGVGFPVLDDAGNTVAAAYGLRYTLSDELRSLYGSMGVNLPAFNGDGSWTLPVPARFVVRPDGVVAYAEVDPDYTTRPDPTELLHVLDGLGTGATPALPGRAMA